MDQFPVQDVGSQEVSTIHPLFQSSVDPTKVSKLVIGVLTTLGGTVMLYLAPHLGIPFEPAAYNAGVQQFGAYAGAVAYVVGQTVFWYGVFSKIAVRVWNALFAK